MGMSFRGCTNDTSALEAEHDARDRPLGVLLVGRGKRPEELWALRHVLEGLSDKNLENRDRVGDLAQLLRHLLGVVDQDGRKVAVPGRVAQHLDGQGTCGLPEVGALADVVDGADGESTARRHDTEEVPVLDERGPRTTLSSLFEPPRKRVLFCDLLEHTGLVGVHERALCTHDLDRVQNLPQLVRLPGGDHLPQEGEELVLRHLSESHTQLSERDGRCANTDQVSVPHVVYPLYHPHFSINTKNSF